MSTYYESDQSAIGRIRARQAATAYRQTLQQPQGFDQLLARYVDAYPYADAKVLYSFAMSGQDPTDPAVQAAMQKSFDVDRKKGFFDHVGDVIGHVTKPIGEAAGFVARGLDAALGPVDESLMPAVKSGVRTAFVVLESPLQEVQTFSRAGLAATIGAFNPHTFDPRGNKGTDFTSILRDSGTSSLREVIGDLRDGDPIDLGSGFLPGGAVEQAVKDKANRLKVRVGGVDFGGPGRPSLTLGRAIAATVSEPGDTAFNVLSGMVDAGVAWYGDPASAVGAVAKEAQVGARTTRALNVLRDDRSLVTAATEFATKPTFAEIVDRSGQGRMIDDVAGRIFGTRKTVDTGANWYAKGGRRVVEKMAETSDPYELWQATRKQIPIETVTRIADTSDPAEVMKILEPMIGVQLRDAPEFLGFKAKPGGLGRYRLMGEMPGNVIDPDNLDDAVEQVDRFLRNAKASPELRRTAFDRVARNTSRETMVATLSDVMGDLADEMAGTIKGRGAAPSTRARKLTELWAGDVEKTRAYFVDEIAKNREAIGLNVGGDAFPVQSPFLYSEYLNSVVPLPEAREIRRATSSLAKFVDTPFFERAVSALSAGQSAWKRLTLLRGAYTARVIGEEQLRMAASGMESMFAHPLSFIAGLVSDDGRLAKIVPNAGRRALDVEGAGFYDDLGNAIPELKQALNEQRFGGWVDQKRVLSDDWTLYQPGDDNYAQAWAEGISELYHDPIAQRAAQAEGNLNSVKDWLWDGDGKGFRKRMVDSHPEMATRDGVDEYVDMLWEGIQYRTQSDPDLIGAIATGKIGDKAIGEWKADRWVNGKALHEHLADRVGPSVIKGRNPDALAERVGFFDNATSWAFDYLGTKPTNYLSRSQSFKQRYWQRIEEMVPYMTDDIRAQAIDGARNAGLPRDVIRRMEKADLNVTRPLDNLGIADQVAKGWALDETKQLLYDLSDKGQFFDVFRLIFPFGEAWKEVLTRWAAIGMENPKVFRRGQQVITGARGNGFFHKDVNGEEIFTYPFSRQISKLLIGVPVDLSGRVAGLNLMSEVLPGVGPVVQIPAAALIPDSPDFDFVRQVISPYGEQDYSQGFLESFLPGYARNIRQALDQGDPRLFANTVGASMDYLASTGKYDMSNPEETAQLFDDAKNMAKKVYAFRAMAQFVSPTSPMPDTLVQDKDGHLDVARVIIDDFHRMQQDPTIGYDGATGEFLKRYGSDLFLLMQGKSFSIAPQLPASKQSAEWERAHQDIVNKYKLTWGLFAPSGDDSDLDYQAYVRQFARGDRQSLTPEQRLSLAQARVGNYLYRQAQAKVSAKPSRSEREWLAAVKEAIRKEYPGYGSMVPGMPARADTATVIAELKRAINDPRLSKSRAAQAARLYLQARTQALAYASEVGVKSLDAEAATPARQWLAQVGNAITQKYPEFQGFYDTVFSREVDDV